MPDEQNESCPLPATPAEDEETMIRRMLRAQRIAIVGLSDDPSRPSYEIGAYLLSQGKTIFPVNPNYEKVLGHRCYRSLAEVPAPVELVNLFRRPEHCADVAREAIGIGAKGVWLQSGILNETARQLARDAKIDFVQNRCILVEHMRRRE